MNPAQLLKHQWEVYPQFHRTRENLLLHIALVPLFLAGNAGLIVALWRGAIVLATLSLVCMLISIALQGRGHRIEAQPPEPFTGPINAISRIFFEQWITFPRFVISGRWARALRGS